MWQWDLHIEQDRGLLNFKLGVGKMVRMLSTVQDFFCRSLPWPARRQALHQRSVENNRLVERCDLSINLLQLMGGLNGYAKHKLISR